MFDITAPKVLAPTVLFGLLVPGFLLSLPPGETFLIEALFHTPGSVYIELFHHQVHSQVYSLNL
jgi:hypothetical protein